MVMDASAVANRGPQLNSQPHCPIVSLASVDFHRAFVHIVVTDFEYCTQYLVVVQLSQLCHFDTNPSPCALLHTFK